MKSKDLIMQELKDKLVAAFKSTDENEIAQAFAGFAESVQQNIMDENKTYQQTADTSILSKRGMHQLTAQESQFYQKLIGAMQSPDIRQAFTTIDLALPETVIDNVMADIKVAHPLLAAIKFTNTTALTKMIINKQGAQLAVWGPLNSAITAEMSGAIGVIDLTLSKLSAFMPISKDMLAVGPAWIDAYVRAVLSEAIALATETAIVTGTGLNMPIGMDRDVSDGVTVTAGVYPKKAAVAITDLAPLAFGGLLATLAAGPLGTRPVTKVLMILNPVDYFTRIFPGTTVRAADGTYATNVFPFPTEVIQSAAVTAGEAIIGIADKYFLGIGAGTAGGKVEFSDEFRFLDDQRVYLTKLYGNGRPLDNGAFIRLDISALVPMALQVYVTNIADTPVV